MSDYTNATMYVELKRDVTDDDLEWIEKLGNHVGTFVYDADKQNDHTLSVGVNEARVIDGIDQFFAAAQERFGDEIKELIVWEDPAYEFLGTLYKWRPEWGEENFSAQCDADGNVVLTEPRLHALLNEDDPVAAIRRDLGWIAPGAPLG